MKQYFSLGQKHVHRVNGQTLDCDCLVEIEGEDKQQCRNRMFELCSDKWAFQYDEDEMPKLLHYFPRGVIKL